MKRLETLDIIKFLISQMVFPFVADVITDNEDGTYTLESCSTFHLQPTFKITIGATEYTITEVSHNTYIKISGPIFPTSYSFNVYNPIFFNGRVQDVDNEIRFINKAKNKTPMIYVMQDFPDRFKSRDEALDRITPLRIFFLTQANNPKWTILQHNEQAVKPMRNLAYNFVDFLPTQKYIDDLDGYEIWDRIKFGKIQNETTKEKNMFAEWLSGCELVIDLPILKTANECCANLVTASTVKIVDQDGAVVEELLPGQIYQITIFDTLTDTIDSNELTITDDLIE
jgi:hypothetical protein